MHIFLSLVDGMITVFCFVVVLAAIGVIGLGIALPLLGAVHISGWYLLAYIPMVVAVVYRQ